VQPQNPGTSEDDLFGVTVISPCDVWVAGFSFSNGANQDLIEHWNGIAWRVVPSPDPGTDNNFLTGIRAVYLNAVRAVSASSVWAVGNFSKGGKEKTLILHWNGHQWRQQAGPNPGTLNALTGIAVTSAADAWAVGFAGNGFAEQTLIPHWNGRKWSRVASPDLGGPRNTNSLNGVAATSASNVWAVGIATHGGQNNTLILRWNGTKWTHVPSPDPGSSNDLDAVAASSAANAWAVGSFNGIIHQTLAIHCC
jgi:hypothetical protein